MSAANYPACLTRVLADEGGYSDDAGDPGGPTKYGITIADYRKYVKQNATADDVKNMTVDEAKTIYAARYWAPVHGDSEAAGLDYATFDYGVNSGVARAGKVLRRLCDLPDNAAWPDVLAAAAKRDPKALSDAMWDERLRFLQSLSTWSRFGGGWGSRVRRGKIASRNMATGAVSGSSGPTPLGGGKGLHPAPSTGAVKSGGAISAAGAGGFFHWFGAHPTFSVAVAVAVVVVVLAVVANIRAAHEAKQTEPMPGTLPVPVGGAA